MNEKDINEVINEQPLSPEPKPLRKLVRVNPSKSTAGNGLQKVSHNAHETAPEQEYHGKYEAEPSGVYHGRYEAEQPDPSHADNEADTQQSGSDIPENNADSKNQDKQKKFSWKDFLVKTGAIVMSLVIIGALVLNLPILRYKKKGQPDEKVSIITYLKRWQPLVEIEGEIDKTIVEPQVDYDVLPEDFNDGLDLPQLVEGQYTVLFLGFDEELMNTDVIWVCQFDIAAAKLNILQIPRDTCFPDYTSSSSGKFNSIYQLGDSSVSPIQRVVNAVQENFGIPIDAYITTACYDIVDMVDLVGGIPITLDEEILYEAGKLIPAGETTLSGEQAEWFVRYRHEWLEGDIGRMKNQRRFMAAAMNKLFDIVKNEGNLKLYSYLKEIYTNKWIATDMSVDDLSKLADFAATLSMENVMVNMVPGEGTPVEAPYIAPDGNAYSIYSVHKQQTIDMLNKYYRPYQKKMTIYESSIVEYYKVHNYSVYDDTGATLSELENATEPPRG
ncbi:MAG: LCP family protein [Ruminococcus sp.]|nr:LCP family protein [Ruminococcus sp.]